MEKAPTTMRTVIVMKENTSRANVMDKVFITIKTAVSRKVNGKMISLLKKVFLINCLRNKV